MQNCWEFHNCGRQSGGAKVNELGLCPASTDSSYSGLNRGKKGGRICWAIAGTFCRGKVQGKFAQKRLTCISCEFYLKVKKEEGLEKFTIVKPNQECSKLNG